MNENNEYRPCLVDGEKAIFHRWVERERLLLRDTMIRSENAAERVYERYINTHVVPRGMDIDKLKDTAAIVEFLDGSVKEVKPDRLRFLDCAQRFGEFQSIFDSIDVGIEVDI